MSATRKTLIAAAVAAASLGSVSGVAAQAERAAFLPWLGCWEAIAAERAAPFGDATPILCVRENADGEGILVATLADGAVRAERELRADGELVPVDEGGCTGWESVAWSGDNHRLYLSSETTCEGGQTRATSGLMAMTSPTEWIEVQAVDAALDHVPVRSRRYRLVAPPAWAPASVLPRTEGRELAIETGRAVASRGLGLVEVQEAARFVMPEVVQAVLVESDADIPVDADALVRLAEAGMDEDVIDVMVALANPDVFVMSAEDPTPARVSSAMQGYSGAAYAYDPFGYGRYSRYDIGWGWNYDPFFRYGYNAFSSPYGYGYDPYGRWYRGGYGSGPIIIIERPGDGEYYPPGQPGTATRRLRYVKGEGYTGGSSSGSAVPRTGTSSPPSSSVGTASGSSGSSSSSTGRKAKPKTGGGGGGGG